MGRVVHFEVHCGDVDRAERFYTSVFGWTTTRYGGPVDYRLIKTGPDDAPGIDGALLARQGEIDGQAVIAFVNTVSVEDLDETGRLVSEHGGQQALDRMVVPGVGHLAYFKDTEGNIFGVLQPDPAVASEPSDEGGAAT